MSDAPQKGPERMFPFVLRARILIIGREVLGRSKSKLQFVLVTSDVSEGVRQQVVADFAHYPIVQHYTAADLESLLGVRGAKVIGFAKSSLAQSLYSELKQFRINAPMHPAKRRE